MQFVLVIQLVIVWIGPVEGNDLLYFYNFLWDQQSVFVHVGRKNLEKTYSAVLTEGNPDKLYFEQTCDQLMTDENLATTSTWSALACVYLNELWENRQGPTNKQNLPHPTKAVLATWDALMELINVPIRPVFQMIGTGPMPGFTAKTHVPALIQEKEQIKQVCQVILGTNYRKVIAKNIVVCRLLIKYIWKEAGPSGSG